MLRIGVVTLGISAQQPLLNKLLLLLLLHCRKLAFLNHWAFTTLLCQVLNFLVVELFLA